VLSYRLAIETDITAIVSLVDSAYRGQSSRQGWTTEADFIEGQRTDFDEVASLMAATDSCFLLCENEQRLLASVQLKKQGKRAYLGMFAVDPQHQGRGAGGALLQKAEEFVMQQWQLDTVYISVISIRLELINWYLRQGYVKTAQQRPFPYDQPRFGIPTRKDLVLEIFEKRLCET